MLHIIQKSMIMVGIIELDEVAVEMFEPKKRGFFLLAPPLLVISYHHMHPFVLTSQDNAVS